MSDQATYHRTFEKFSMGMWPIWKKNPNGWNYRGQAVFRQEQEDSYAKTVDAFYANQRVGKSFNKVRVMPKKDQNFDDYATAWEDYHSELTSLWTSRVEPVVDDEFMIIGHLGWFYATEIYIPQNQNPQVDIQHHLLDQEVPVYADARSKAPSYMKSNYVGKPVWKYLLYTSPDGLVLGVFGFDVGDGAVSTMPPWEMISIARASLVLARGGASYVVKMATRARTARAVANGPTRQAIERVPAPAGGTAVATGPLVVKSAKVTRAEMLAWEKEGGHALQNHGPQLTRENLKARITGKEQISAPQIQRGGYKPPDMRVWQGDKSLAASKFAGEEEMHKAIGKVINDNIDEIRRLSAAGQQVTLANRAVGFKTGSGWVTGEAAKEARAAMWVEDLKGVTVIIRKRANHVPTPKDPEGWYVHTAFPDMAK